MEEAQVMMAGVRAEFVDPKLRLLTTFRYVWGRTEEPGRQVKKDLSAQLLC